jgi:hypothetical protein
MKKNPIKIIEYLKSCLHLIVTFSDNHPYQSHASIKFGSCFLGFLILGGLSFTNFAFSDQKPVLAGLLCN